MVEKMDEMKEILLKMKEETLNEISKAMKSGSETPTGEPSGDIYDQASSERDRELDLLLGNREREKLRNIDEALLKIDEGEYGVCEECPLLREVQGGHRKTAGPDQAFRGRPGLPGNRPWRRGRELRGT